MIFRSAEALEAFRIIFKQSASVLSRSSLYNFRAIPFEKSPLPLFGKEG